MLLALAVLFLGSGGLGLLLAGIFAPGSWLASVVGLFALPVAFALSMQWWFGLALLGAVVRLVRRGGARPGPQARTEPLPGSFIFLPVSATMGLAAGMVIGFLSPTHSIGVVTGLYWAIGIVHGAAGWRLARAGVLMPPESI